MRLLFASATSYGRRPEPESYQDISQLLAMAQRESKLRFTVCAKAGPDHSLQMIFALSVRLYNTLISKSSILSLKAACLCFL